MTDITMAFMELLRKHELDIDSDFLRSRMGSTQFIK